MIPEEKNHNHELLIFLTFVALIAAGTVALKLPLVHHSNGVTFLDALFIATSAVCVTGLTTIPTSGFNLSGQIIILILIQVGAIGIMTFTASFILFFRGEPEEKFNENDQVVVVGKKADIQKIFTK